MNGYGVVQTPKHQQNDAPALDGISLRYLVAPLNTGIVMRLQYQDMVAARFYPRGADGSLEMAPFTVRQAGPPARVPAV